MKKYRTAVKLGIMMLCMALTAACSSDSGATTNPASKGITSTAAAQEGSATVEMGDNAALAAARAVEYSDYDLNAEWSMEKSTRLSLNASSTTVEGAGVAVSGSTITITEAGVYVLSGTLDDGQVIVDVPNDQKVQLVLNGVSLNSSSSAPLYIKEADKVVLTLAEGTENTVSDAKSYVYPDASTDGRLQQFSAKVT